MARTLETPIQKRFSDVDPFQHVNNVSQQMYFDVGKMEFYEKVLGAEVLLADLRILAVSTSTSYLGQVQDARPRAGDDHLRTGGNEEPDALPSNCSPAAEVRSESRSVMVVFDFARQRSEPVPDAWRERLLAD